MIDSGRCKVVKDEFFISIYCDVENLFNPKFTVIGKRLEAYYLKQFDKLYDMNMSKISEMAINAKGELTSLNSEKSNYMRNSLLTKKSFERKIDRRIKRDINRRLQVIAELYQNLTELELFNSSVKEEKSRARKLNKYHIRYRRLVQMYGHLQAPQANA